MPTSTLRTTVAGMQPQELNLPAAFRPNDVFIHTMSNCAAGPDIVGMGAATFASATYPSANRGLGYMFTIGEPFLAVKVFWLNGTTASTDVADVGVYTEAGVELITATTPPTITTASRVQEADCTDTLLMPGRYWCVYAQSGVTATPIMSAVTVGNMRAAGLAQMAGAMSGNALGSTFTPAVISAANIGWFGIAGRTQVA